MPGDREPLSLPSVPLISRSEMATLLRLIVAEGLSNKAYEFNSSSKQRNDLPMIAG